MNHGFITTKYTKYTISIMCPFVSFVCFVANS